MTDITEHSTNEGKLYLCAVKDVFSGRIVGYSISDRMKVRLVMNTQRHIPPWRCCCVYRTFGPREPVPATGVRACSEPSSPHRIDGEKLVLPGATPQWNPFSHSSGRTPCTASGGGPGKSCGSRSSLGASGPTTAVADRPAWADFPVTFLVAPIGGRIGVAGLSGPAWFLPPVVDDPGGVATGTR